MFLIDIEKTLTDEFIQKYTIHWKSITKSHKLSETFIEQHQDKLDWWYISFYHKLSEPFMEKYIDYIKWDCITTTQKLSEPFIDRQVKHIKRYLPLFP